MAIPKVEIYIVGDTGRDGHIHAIFTDRSLADECALVFNSHVEEWDANIPSGEWCLGSARLWAEKKDGKWVIGSILSNGECGHVNTGPVNVDVVIGHCAGWGEPDPATGQYTHAQVSVQCRTMQEAKDMCIAEFWKKIAEIDPKSL